MTILKYSYNLNFRRKSRFEMNIGRSKVRVVSFLRIQVYNCFQQIMCAWVNVSIAGTLTETLNNTCSYILQSHNFNKPKCFCNIKVCHHLYPIHLVKRMLFQLKAHAVLADRKLKTYKLE